MYFSKNPTKYVAISRYLVVFLFFINRLLFYFFKNGNCMNHFSTFITFCSAPLSKKQLKYCLSGLVNK